MATFELYRRSTIGMCLTETLDEMVQNGTLSPEIAIQVLVQFDKVNMPISLPSWVILFLACDFPPGDLVIDSVRDVSPSR